MKYSNKKFRNGWLRFLLSAVALTVFQLGTISQSMAQFGTVGNSNGLYNLLNSELRIQEGTSDVTPGWLMSRTIDMRIPIGFKWKNNSSTVIEMQFQVSTIPLSSGNPSPFQTGVIKANWVAFPAAGQGKLFQIDFTDILPSNPTAAGKDYYIRVVTWHSDGIVRVPSQTVTLTYKANTQQPTKFTAEGLGMLVRQRQAWMYANVPMPVEVDLQELYVGNDNEATGDEPYLIPFVLYVDGQSVNVLDFPSSAIRYDQTDKTVGNLPEVDVNGEEIEPGSTVEIPASTGVFTDTITPIGYGLADEMEDPNNIIGQAMKDYTSIFIVVVAMEHDNSKPSTISAVRDVARDILLEKINTLVQQMNILQLINGVSIDFETELKSLRNDIQLNALLAAFDSIAVSGWWTPAYQFALIPQVDYDEIVGFDYAEVTLGQLLDSNPSGVPFELDFFNSQDWQGSYRLNGRVRRLNFTSRDFVSGSDDGADNRNKDTRNFGRFDDIRQGSSRTSGFGGSSQPASRGYKK